MKGYLSFKNEGEVHCTNLLFCTFKTIEIIALYIAYLEYISIKKHEKISNQHLNKIETL